jgi:hypothetical protein
MSKILKSIVGLAIIGSSLAFAATPAKAESKVAQCRRFGQAVATFGNQLPDVKRDQDYSSQMSQWLSASEAGLKQLQSQKFTDPKIRSFQQSTLNVFVQTHNDMISLVESAERRDRSGYMVAAKQIDQDLKAFKPLGKSINAYCGRSK